MVAVAATVVCDSNLVTSRVPYDLMRFVPARQPRSSRLVHRAHGGRPHPADQVPHAAAPEVIEVPSSGCRSSGSLRRSWGSRKQTRHVACAVSFQGTRVRNPGIASRRKPPTCIACEAPIELVAFEPAGGWDVPVYRCRRVNRLHERPG